MTATQRQILRLERAQERNFNRRKLKPILEHFDPKFVGFSSTVHTRITGRRDLGKTFDYYLRQSPRLTYRITQPRVQVFGATAIASFYWKVRFNHSQALNGRGTHVYIKRGRRWKIVHEHFSRAH